MTVIYEKTKRSGTGWKQKIVLESGMFKRYEGPNVIVDCKGVEKKILKERVKEYIY